MQIRFLRTSPSGIPDAPFQAGQIITVSRLTPDLQVAIEVGSAEVLADAPVAAIQPSVERAVLPKAKSR